MVSPVAQIEPLIRFAREKNSWGNGTLFVEVCRLIAAVNDRLTAPAKISILEFLEMSAPRVNDEALEAGAAILSKHEMLHPALKDWILRESPETMLVVLLKGQLQLDDADFLKIGDRGTAKIFAAVAMRDDLPTAVLSCLSARLTGEDMRVFLEKHAVRMPLEACVILRRRAEFVPEIDARLLPH